MASRVLCPFCFSPIFTLLWLFDFSFLEIRSSRLLNAMDRLWRCLFTSDSLEKRVATLKDPHFFLRSVRFFFLWGRGDHDQYLTMPRHV